MKKEYGRKNNSLIINTKRRVLGMEILKKSQYVQFIEDGEMAVVWHSLFGYPQIVNRNGLELIDAFSNPIGVDEIKKAEKFDEIDENVAILKNSFMLVPPDFNERSFLEKKTLSYNEAISDGKNIEYLSIIPSEKCNFCCTYCISNSMIDVSYRKGNKKRIMSWETAKKAIDVFLSILRSHNKKQAYINFGGGEPLLNWKLVDRTLSYCQNVYEKDFEFIFRINTNASLINRNVAETLKAHGVKIALSMDGLSGANDKVRISKSGVNSFVQIIKAMDILSDINFGLTGFSTTITEENFDLIDENLILFAQKRGFIDLRVDLDVIHMLSVPVDVAAQKLLYLKSFAESKGIQVTGFWERPIENANHSVLERNIAFCGGIAGKSMCVNPSEDVFICGYSAKKFASLSRAAIISSDIYKNIVSARMVGNIDRCKNCIIEGQCVGGCHITEEFGEVGNNLALQYNCELYRTMTLELFKDSLRKAIMEST